MQTRITTPDLPAPGRIPYASRLGLLCLALLLTGGGQANEQATEPSNVPDLTVAPLSAADRCAAAPLDETRKAALSRSAGDRRGTPAPERASAILTLASDRIREASPSARRCERTLEKGAKRFEKALRKETRRMSGNAGAANSEDPALREVQTALAEAFLADQAARLAYLELATDDEDGERYWARQLATSNAIRIDGENTALLKSLLTQYDWIDAHRFGPRIASHAWIIAQHADADPAFQAQALERMAQYLDKDGVRARDYAYLFDRVAVNTGQAQRYGTQPQSQCNADGTLSPKPLEDPQGVDDRRAELGMEPMADAMAEMAARRCR